ncbi:PAS domain-containing protein, partial [Dehalococcoidia bacterium]|nr:PAS domain-containing protein [Dehalococcoidia bacterium]
MRRRILELEKSEVACQFAQERLRNSEEFIETVFNSVNDSISVIDTSNFEIVGVNRAFLDTVKMEEKDVIGKTCYEVTHHR